MIPESDVFAVLGSMHSNRTGSLFDLTRGHTYHVNSPDSSLSKDDDQLFLTRRVSERKEKVGPISGRYTPTTIGQVFHNYSVSDPVINSPVSRTNRGVNNEVFEGSRTLNPMTGGKEEARDGKTSVKRSSTLPVERRNDDYLPKTTAWKPAQNEKKRSSPDSSRVRITENLTLRN